MYQVLFPEGQIECDSYQEAGNGIELYDADDEFVAFVPFSNLHAVIDEEKASRDASEPSVM
ncbi:MAG: hypothetical protein ABEJ78_06610 [Haloferacaceae archaeon]